MKQGYEEVAVFNLTGSQFGVFKIWIILFPVSIFFLPVFQTELYIFKEDGSSHFWTKEWDSKC